MTDLRLHWISGSGPCWRVMLALARKGLDFESIRLDPSKGEQKTPGFLALNPRGKVPVLEHGDFVLTESFAILHYLEALAPDPTLFGEDEPSRSLMLSRLLEHETYLHPHLQAVAGIIFRDQVAAKQEALAEAAEASRMELTKLENQLEGPYLLGRLPTAWDLTVFTDLMRVRRALGRVPELASVRPLGSLLEDSEKFASWFAHIEAWPGYEDAYPPHWRAGPSETSR